MVWRVRLQNQMFVVYLGQQCREIQHKHWRDCCFLVSGIYPAGIAPVMKVFIYFCTFFIDRTLLTVAVLPRSPSLWGQAALNAFLSFCVSITGSIHQKQTATWFRFVADIVDFLPVCFSPCRGFELLAQSNPFVRSLGSVGVLGDEISAVWGFSVQNWWKVPRRTAPSRSQQVRTAAANIPKLSGPIADMHIKYIEVGYAKQLFYCNNRRI